MLKVDDERGRLKEERGGFIVKDQRARVRGIE